MLEQPNLPDDKIITCLLTEYALRASQIAFLPLGADQNTVVYRVITDDETPYFLKLRRGVFDETSVALPGFLHDQGIRHIIAPLTTQAGQLWASLDDYTVIVYPFINGRDGYDVDLSDRHWIEFGAALKRIHTANVPSSITSLIPRESYSAQWRDLVRMFLARIDAETFDDPVAAQTAEFLQSKRDEILALVERTERLAEKLQAQPLDGVVCHSDLHAGNIFMDGDGALYIVDWDNPIIAPKERDLMFAGGGQFGNARTAREEEALFYRGYGPTSIDPVALAYYRYERIVEDIAVECQLIFSTAGDEDRERELRFMRSNFEPDGVLAIAYASDHQVRQSYQLRASHDRLTSHY
jgi:spectinomycin phosphotransferase